MPVKIGIQADRNPNLFQHFFMSLNVRESFPSSQFRFSLIRDVAGSERFSCLEQVSAGCNDSADLSLTTDVELPAGWMKQAKRCYNFSITLTCCRFWKVDAMARFTALLFSACLIPLLLCSCEGPADPATSQITLALNWLPEAEHGGFYAALLNGDYAAEGLDVEILPGGPDSPVIQRVGARKVTFGIANADRIALGQSQEAKVVGILAPMQNSPRCIMVHEDSGITSFEELKNVTLAMSDAPAFSYYLKAKLPLEGVRVVRYTGSIAQFLRDPNYAQQAYVFSEPIIARKEGAKVRTLMVSDLGFNPYTSVLVTHEQTILDHPEMVEKFVRAIKKGWERYLADPSAVHKHLHKLNPEMPIDVLDAGLAELKKLSAGEDGQFSGQMDPTRWKTLVQQLEEIQLLEPGQVEPEKLFTTQFLNPQP